MTHSTAKRDPGSHRAIPVLRLLVRWSYSMRAESRLAVLCVIVGALLCVAPAAHAACTASTPSETVFTDPAGDVDGVAADLTQLKFSVDAACTFAFDPKLSGLTSDDYVFTYVDRDGNPATGDTSVFGSEILTVTLTEGTQTATLSPGGTARAPTTSSTSRTSSRRLRHRAATASRSTGSGSFRERPRRSASPPSGSARTTSASTARPTTAIRSRWP